MFVSNVDSIQMTEMKDHEYIWTDSLNMASSQLAWYPGWGTSRKLGWRVQPTSKTLTLFMTKICDIPYRIYDLTKNSKPYSWPDPKIQTLFQTCVKISSLVQTDVKLP